MGSKNSPSDQRRRAAKRAEFRAEFPLPPPADRVKLTDGERAGARRCPSTLPGGVLCDRPPVSGYRSRSTGRVYLRCPVHRVPYSMPPEQGDLLRPLAAFTWAEVMTLRFQRKAAAVS